MLHSFNVPWLFMICYDVLLCQGTFQGKQAYEQNLTYLLDTKHIEQQTYDYISVNFLQYALRAWSANFPPILTISSHSSQCRPTILTSFANEREKHRAKLNNVYQHELPL
jgi:hypothetical protein